MGRRLSIPLSVSARELFPTEHLECFILQTLCLSLFHKEPDGAWWPCRGRRAAAVLIAKWAESWWQDLTTHSRRQPHFRIDCRWERISWDPFWSCLLLPIIPLLGVRAFGCRWWRGGDAIFPKCSSKVLTCQSGRQRLFYFPRRNRTEAMAARVFPPNLPTDFKPVKQSLLLNFSAPGEEVWVQRFGGATRNGQFNFSWAKEEPEITMLIV